MYKMVYSFYHLDNGFFHVRYQGIWGSDAVKRHDDVYSWDSIKLDMNPLKKSEWRVFYPWYPETNFRVILFSRWQQQCSPYGSLLILEIISRIPVAKPSPNSKREIFID